MAIHILVPFYVQKNIYKTGFEFGVDFSIQKSTFSFRKGARKGKYGSNLKRKKKTEFEGKFIKRDHF